MFVTGSEIYLLTQTLNLRKSHLRAITRFMVTIRQLVLTPTIIIPLSLLSIGLGACITHRLKFLWLLLDENPYAIS